LPHLVMAGNTMKAALTWLEPALKASGMARETLGTVVLGTVAGDIHEIGKSLVGVMLTANGFVVHDLGVDVPASNFIQAARETGADLVALSALLTTTMSIQRTVIEELVEAGLRDRVKVMVGGAPVSTQWAQEIGADGYAEDAVGAVALARQLAGAGNG
jgi:methanogenic corrinoid protein MtbC1